MPTVSPDRADGAISSSGRIGICSTRDGKHSGDVNSRTDTIASSKAGTDIDSAHAAPPPACLTLSDTFDRRRSLPPSPLIAASWRRALAAYPDRKAADLILDIIEHGADIGYVGDRRGRLHCRNLPSAREHPEAITKDIDEEVAAGRIAGPFRHPPVPNLVISPLGCVPKRGSSKFRRIHHLSWPRGSSINDFITKLDCRYASFDHALSMVRRLGPGCFLVKVDIKSAFRCIPVRPEDWPLLGMSWQGHFFLDMCLPFGLRSSPGIWERFSTAFEWILRHCGPSTVAEVVHYVDDYLSGAATRDECMRVLTTILSRCRDLGLPVAHDKLVGPATAVPFLGVTIDTVSMQAKLDSDRLAEIKLLVSSFSTRDSCSVKELRSLIGKLCFAARVAQPGRVFISAALETLRNASGSSIIISPSLRADLAWWREFITSWNGVAVVPDAGWSSPDVIHLWTDASALGYGAVCERDWMAVPWSRELLRLAARDAAISMPFLELYALASAAATWGHRWRGRRVDFHCDSKTVVEAAQLRHTASPALSQLFRCLYLSAARNQFSVRVTHVPGLSNRLADALSRLQIDAFRALMPHAARLPTTPSPLPIPLC